MILSDAFELIMVPFPMERVMSNVFIKAIVRFAVSFVTRYSFMISRIERIYF